MQERCNSIINALELRLSCTYPWIWSEPGPECLPLCPCHWVGRVRISLSWVTYPSGNRQAPETGVQPCTWRLHNCMDFATYHAIEGYVWSPFHEWFFHHNSNSMEISFCSHPSCSEVITIKFCTRHDSCAVMPCAKFCSDMMPNNGVTL